MEKLNMENKNNIKEKVNYIKDKFPNAIINELGEIKIDFDILKQELSEYIGEGTKERYQLNWAGKKEAIINANKPINLTLSPEKNKSVEFEKTKNIYIEGNNLDALKILKESHLGKVDIIYIDPPYNTGNDFIYKDKFENEVWLSMMYSRIKLARKFLTDTGIMYISIGDDEVNNLKIICDEIFGKSNFIANCTRIAKRTSNKGNFFKPTKDYVLVYARNISNITWKFGAENKVREEEFTLEDEKGKYKKNGASLYQPSLDSRPNQRYYIECPDGSLIIPPGTVFPTELEDGAKVKPLSNNDKCWRWSVETYLNNKDKLIFTPARSTCPLIDSNGNPSKWNIYDKVYLDDKIDEALLPEDVIYDYVNSQGTKEILSLGLNFSFAKPVGLVKYLIKITKMPKDITVMDFFSGSATTAQAVMELNAEDNGNRKYILVQLPEKIDDNEFENICELGQERIRRAAKKIKEETNANIDYGFKVYKIDYTNIEDVYYKPEKLK